ncbi:TatD family hydrolase [Fluviicola taffensis]|uniref:TatD-related deoxyribonuclease n=1 Tax=Fluviicola taffensis (strain DSM 16823 / NCIMB 13979 / RW262) TaxID=755732 RepID=F2ICC6_FLUTR|nr:TatD family hydrolase [Fluviicola taffensis]AEA44372.1 TatD-related deoxyribonuclease [Fluviicola taffensis DSM 16823]
MSDLESLFDSHTHNFETKNRGIVQLTELSGSQLPEFFSFGIHPKEQPFNLEELDLICSELSSNPGFLAIGEIGLDNRYDAIQKQEELYVFQLKIAQKLQKPVILHCVNTWDRCRFLHEKNAPNTSIIYHGFNKASITKNVLEYQQAIISIGESILTNQKLQSGIQQIPLERLLLETDMGEIDLIETYQMVAEIKKVSLYALTEQLNKNANRIFKYE